MSLKENIIELSQGEDGVYREARVVSVEKPKKERKPKAQKPIQSLPVVRNEKTDNFIEGMKVGLQIFREIKKLVR